MFRTTWRAEEREMGLASRQELEGVGQGVERTQRKRKQRRLKCEMVSKDSSRADPGKTKEIKPFFEAMDANGSGTIDAKELKGLITAML